MKLMAAITVSTCICIGSASPVVFAARSGSSFLRDAWKACGSLLTQRASADVSAEAETNWFSPENQPDVDREYLNETLFVIPANDGEGVRSLEILTGLAAPNVHVGRQGWGASIDFEVLDPELLNRVERVVVFEMPGLKGEAAIVEAGKELVIVDHHASRDFPDRYRNESSIEQLATLVGYRLNAFDRAVGINDRAYIPGLRKAGLSEELIRNVRNYDLGSQGRTAERIRRATEDAQDLIPFLATHGDVTFFSWEHVDGGILNQELALGAPDGVVKIFSWRDGISYSGSTETVDRLAALDLKKHGLQSEDFSMYHGGDREGGSMFFGLKPKSRTGPRIPEAMLDEAFSIARSGAVRRPIEPRRPADEVKFETFGSRPKPAIVFVPGPGVSIESFRPIARLLERDFFVIAYDVRGARSTTTTPTGADYSAEVLAADLEALLDHLRVPSAHLIAQGLGASTALRFAVSRPGRTGKVLVEAHSLGPPERYDAITNDTYARKLSALRRYGRTVDPTAIGALIFRARARREITSVDLRRLNPDRLLMLASPDLSIAARGSRIKYFTDQLRTFLRDEPR